MASSSDRLPAAAFTLVPASRRASIAAKLIVAAGSITRPIHGKGHWHLARLAAALATPDQRVSLRLGAGGQFLFPMRDPYWSRFLLGSARYEPEVESTLRAAAHLNFSFYDCGANFGYWSAFCTGLGCRRVVAVEASESTCRFLAENARANGFTALHRALHSRSGIVVRIDEDQPHAGRHVDFESDSGGNVETISIDDLVGDDPGPLIVKLDVEGQEIAAFAGARRTARKPALFIYEDHGKDPASKCTQWILANTDLTVSFVDGDGTCHSIDSAADASAFKKRSRHGYNFIAASPDWRKSTG